MEPIFISVLTSFNNPVWAELICINSFKGLNYNYQNKSYDISNKKTKMPFSKEGGVSK